MILVDTSVWIDHLRASDAGLTALLNEGQVLMHPFVLGEISLGRLRQRELLLGDLLALPQALVATDAEVLAFAERYQLSGLGIGWVDVHLLTATRLMADALLWTRDKRLHEVCARVGVAFVPR